MFVRPPVLHLNDLLSLLFCTRNCQHLSVKCTTMNISIFTSNTCLFSLLVIIAITSPAWSLRCWVCASHEDGRCSDPFNSTYMWQDDCSPEQRPNSDQYIGGVYVHQPERYAVCKKVKQIENGRLTYIRSCGFESHKNGACNPEGDRTFTDNVKFCGTCESDYCNSSPSMSVVGAWLLISVVVAVTRLHH